MDLTVDATNGRCKNISPAQFVSLVAQLDPGTYCTAWRFERVGSPVGLAGFTVTGEAALGRQA